MSGTRASDRGLSLPKFVFLTVGGVSAAMAVGYLPTVRLGGTNAVWGMLAASGIVLAGSFVGLVPLLSVRRNANFATAVITSMVIRFVFVLALAGAFAVAGLFEPASLLIWVGICYLVALAVDTWFAIRLLRQPQ